VKILFLFPFLLFAQSAIRIQDEGISNYQIQNNVPTVTPATGSKYLYDQNSVLMRKDSAGDIERVRALDTNNVIGNPDVEQGLTLYTSPSGMTLNEATPLEGKRSIDFDATMTDDFVETQLYTIPIGLMGQNCMVRVLVKGGDANLQVQVVNGNNQIIVFKQLETFADATYQYLTFRCPTQAEINTTPQLGQFKIKIVQTTATDAALVTLDKFYLGEFASNTLNVQGQTEEFRATGGAIGTGSNLYWNTVRENTILNTGSLVNTSANGLTFTAKQSVILNITASNYQSGSAVDVELILNGVLQMRQSQPWGQSNVSGELHLNVGDIVRIHTNMGVGAATESSVLITATPLPALATVVANPNFPAGFYAGRKWNGGNCSWSWTAIANSPTNAPAVAACGPLAKPPEGFATVDAVTDGQIPKLTISKLDPGYYEVCLTGSLWDYSNDSSTTSFRISNGTLNTTFGTPSTASVESSGMTNCGYLKNPTLLTNTIFTVQASGVGGNQTSAIVLTNNGREFEISFKYLPDLSSPYNQSIIAALEPQIHNSSGKRRNEERCYITNGGVALLASPSCDSWIQSVNRTSAGIVSGVFIPNVFNSSSPDCNLTPFNSNRSIGMNALSLTGFTTTTTVSNNATPIGSDDNFYISCGGFLQ